MRRPPLDAGQQQALQPSRRRRSVQRPRFLPPAVGHAAPPRGLSRSRNRPGGAQPDRGHRRPGRQGRLDAAPAAGPPRGRPRPFHLRRHPRPDRRTDARVVRGGGGRRLQPDAAGAALDGGCLHRRGDPPPARAASSARPIMARRSATTSARRAPIGKRSGARAPGSARRPGHGRLGPATGPPRTPGGKVRPVPWRPSGRRPVRPPHRRRERSEPP